MQAAHSCDCAAADSANRNTDVNLLLAGYYSRTVLVYSRIAHLPAAQVQRCEARTP